MEKSINVLQWYGKPKFHYEVKWQCKVIYRCTSTAQYQEDVLDALIDRFRQEKGVVSIFRNGDKVAVLNRLKITFKSI